MGPATGESTRELVTTAVGASFLRPLPAGTVEAVQRDAVLHHVGAGRVFIDAYEPHWVGIIVSGLARVYLDPDDGPEITVRYVRSGAAVGIAALAGERHPVSVRAVTPCRVLQLDIQRLLMVAEADPAASMAISRELAARLLDTYQELTVRVCGSVRQRLARQLLEEIGGDVQVSAGTEVLSIRRTHQELADSIGSAREVVSRVLSGFVREKLVELDRGRISLLDPVQLHLVANRRVSEAARRSSGT
jgi:CRP-like cAMP-binding protein